MNDDIGKKGESKVREWLDNRLDEGYVIDRLYDPMGGLFGVSNPCDFIAYRYPNIYYIECKSTWADRFDFAMISPGQMKALTERSSVQGCQCWVIVLFATYKRAFRFKASDIKSASDNDIKSLNIKKIDKWPVPYKELTTIPSKKLLLDYSDNLEDLM